MTRLLPPRALPRLERNDFEQGGANFSRLGSLGCMGVFVGHRPGRETTRRLLEQIAGGQAGRRLRAQLARWNTDATADQIEDAFQEACARADRACVGQVEGEVYCWLRTTAHRELARQRRRLERELVVDVCVDELELAEPCAPAADITVMRREDHAEVARIANVVLAQLSERQRDVVALHAHGLRRRQIADHLQLSPRTVKRLLEQVLAIGREELVRHAGHGCTDGEPLVARLAFGLADDRQARLAQLHLTTCRRCGAMYERLDLWREKVAALLPIPPVAGAHEHVAERVVHSAADALSGPAGAAPEGPAGLRRHATDVVAQLREHATAAYYRTIDPMPLAGARPGAVAATVAGCLAAGGAGTYCAQQVGDPITALRGLAAATQKDDRPKAQPKRAAVAPVPAPVVTQTAPPPPVVVQQPPPPPPPPVTSTTPAAPPPSPQQEFEPTAPASASTTSTQPRPAPTPGPSPAPADGPTEFGGP